MNLPTPDSGAGGGPAPGQRIPVRPLTAWVLLALAGLVLLFGLLAWMFPSARMELSARLSPDRFTSLPVLVGPLLAMLVAARLGPPLRHAPIMGLVALAEYATALVLGAMGFLITFAVRFDDLGSGIYAFGSLLQRLGGIVITLAELGLLGLAALWTYQLFTSVGGRLPGSQLRSS
jgi:hypothetical protein